MLSLEEPVRLERFQPSYKPHEVVPIDLSSIFLEDSALVYVRVYLGDPDSPSPYPLEPDPLVIGTWGPYGGAGTLKKKPGDAPTVGFRPPVPGTYFVAVVGITTASVPLLWKSRAITVTA